MSKSTKTVIPAKAGIPKGSGVVPRLRFPEFRGVEEWEVKKLGDKDVSSFVNKRVLVDALDLDSYVSTENILPDFGGIKKASKLPSSGSFTCYKPNDILIANIRPYLKKVWVADKSGGASNDVIVVRPMKKVKDSFLSSILKNEMFIDYVMSGAKGVKMPRGDISLVKEYSISIPGPEEQQKIADCLSSLDTLITAQAEKINALKIHKKGLMQQLFPREGETTPRLRFPKFRGAGEWEETTLGKYLSRHPEYGINAPSVPYSENLPTYLRITDISDDGRIRPEQKVSVAKEVTEENYLEEGDVVLARTGASVGKAYKYRIDDGRLVFAGFLIRVKPNRDKLNSEFLFQYLSTERYWNWVDFSSARSGQPGINGNEYASLPMPLPPSLTEQQKIADGLSSIDVLIAAQAEKLDTLKTHKKGLMQQLFPSEGD